MVSTSGAQTWPRLRSTTMPGALRAWAKSYVKRTRFAAEPKAPTLRCDSEHWPQNLDLHPGSLTWVPSLSTLDDYLQQFRPLLTRAQRRPNTGS